MIKFQISSVVSVSENPEKLLAEAAGPVPQARAVSFSQRWRGRMQQADQADERATRLRAKYKLIITRNLTDYKGSPIKAVPPGDCAVML